jgi:CRISP-associated protein Cas1
MDDLRQLPKLRDSLSYLYVEHCRIDREASAIALFDKEGETHVPAASLAILMLGPGTRITHAAVHVLAESNCLVLWCGEQGVRFYAGGLGGTRSAAGLLHQARLVSDPQLRLQVAARMYRMRFQEEVDPNLTLEQLRGWEGRRVRDAYARVSRETGVPWHGRSYERGDWSFADPVNRALSAANACLYGICHAAILALGLSPAMGFIHTGKQLSFVYDIADLYKTTITIPVSFKTVAAEAYPLERAVRLACRDLFREHKLLEQLALDLPRALGLKAEEADVLYAADVDAGIPGYLWDPGQPAGAPGGMNYSPEAAPGDPFDDD